MSFYQAVLMVRAPLLLLPDRGGKDVRAHMSLASSRLPLNAWRHSRELLRRAPPQGEQLLVLYPRTNVEGYLWRGTMLRFWYDPAEKPEREPGFHALGKLAKVDKKEALLVLQIFPNPEGQLSKPFTLPLIASLDLLETLPKVGSGLEVWGELKMRSGRVVVTKAETVALPPVKARPKQVGEKVEKVADDG